MTFKEALWRRFNLSLHDKISHIFLMDVPAGTKSNNEIIKELLLICFYSISVHVFCTLLFFLLDDLLIFLSSNGPLELRGHCRKSENRVEQLQVVGICLIYILESTHYLISDLDLDQHWLDDFILLKH